MVEIDILRRRLPLPLVLLGLLGDAVPIVAQEHDTSARTSDARISEGKAFLLSAVVPGAAQYARGQERWIGYLAAEAAAWTFWARARSRAHDFENAFRDLAWETARDRVQPRRDGDWEYYERMSSFTRSGAYDRDPEAPGIQPEVDPATFNGDAWRLARQIHFGPGPEPGPGDPAYEEALDFYRERAVETGFTWDWSGQEEARARFGELVAESDDAFGDASLLAGAVVLNHLLSAVDGFLSARASSLAARPIQLRSGFDLPQPGLPIRFSLSARVDIR